MRRFRTALATLSLVAIGAFVAALLALHVASFRDEPDHMSQFANSQFGVLWALAVYTFIVGGAMLVWALKPRLANCPSKLAGLVMLCLAGMGSLLLAVFPADATLPVTMTGEIHDRAALTTFVLLGAAMIVLAPAFRSSPSLGRFAGVSLTLGLLVTVSWATYLVLTLQEISMRGPVQRVLVALIVAWFVLLALKLRKERVPMVAVRRPKTSTAATTAP